jgi:copper chaperone
MMEEKTLKVNGMSCEHCVKAVNKALGEITGVTDITVSLKEGTVSFKHDPARARLETIKTAITGEGFEIA